MSPAEPVWRTSRASGAALGDAAVVSAVAALLLLPSLLHGAPTGNDYPHHAAWVEAFTAEQGLARPYPRWLGTLWFGAGGADFYFYAPLAYWLAAAVRGTVCAGCDAGTLLALVGLVGLIASGLGFRALGLRFAGRGPALVAALVYMALPYHLGADWYHRLALAEFVALGVLPWHLAAFVDCLRGRAAGPRLALLSALLALAHLPTALIAGLACGVLFLALGRAPGWRPLATCGLAGAVGLGLAAIYWVPAIMLIDSVSTDQLGGIFVSIANMLISLNAEREPLIATLLFGHVGLSAAVVAILLAAPRREGSPATAVAALLVLSWVMVTPLSLPLWQATPVARVQFPWRFLLVAELAVGLAALLAVGTLARPGALRRGVAAACLGAIVVLAALAHPSVNETRERRALPNPRAPVLAGAFEWLPRESAASSEVISYTEWWHILDAAKEAARGPTVRLQGPGAARVLAEAPRELRFEADLAGAAPVVLHRTYWRFWRLEDIDTGAEIALKPTDGFPLLSATLPAGRAQYRLVLPTLPEERAGALISAAALLALLAWFLVSRPRRRS